MDGKSSFRRLFDINVTGLGRPASNSLVPPLLPGSSVQEIVGGACYLYTTPDGNYLSPGQAKAVGRVLRPAPPPPRLLTAVAWLSWFRRPLLALVGISSLILVVVILVWFGFRFLMSRE
jgi:hypothetical protein